MGQQRQMLENMNPQQRAIYLNKLRGEKEAQLRQQQQMIQQRQQMMIQQQQGQQQPGIMQQQQTGMINQPGMVQMQQQQQQQQQWGGATPTSGYPQHSSPAPMSPIQQMGNLSPGHVSPNRMPSPVQNPGLRQA